MWPPATSTPPTGGFFTRAQERESVSVRRTDLGSKTVPTRHPSDPGGIPIM